MSSLSDTLAYLASNAGGLAMVGAAIAFIWSVIWSMLQYFDVRRLEFQKREFVTYHRLIQELVEPGSHGVVLLDRQIAVVFELRNFERYYEVTARILHGLREFWNQNPTHKRLIDEIDITLKNIEGNKK